MNLTTQLLLLSVVMAAKCAVCRRKRCDAWLWSPDDRDLQPIHQKCLRML